MTWALEEITLPISCNLCAQEFGDLQTYHTHARLTHLPFPAPTIRESRHAQPARQPRRHRQHSRDGHGREPRIHQEGRQRRQRRATAKAAPTNSQQRQARRRGSRTDGSGNETTQGRIQARPEEPKQGDAEINSQTAPDDTRTDLDGVGHTVGQSIETRSRQHAEADANLRGKGTTKGARTHSRTTFRMGEPGSGLVSSAERQYSGSTNSTGNCELVCLTGASFSSPNMRRDAILQAGQNVQSGREENNVKYRVTGKTTPRTRSTQSNRGRAQIRTSSAHSHGTGTTNISGRTNEDVKIMVRTFPR